VSLNDGDAGRGADSDCAGVEHGGRFLVGADAAGGLHREVFAHQLHISDSRAAVGEPRGGLHHVGVGLDGGLAGAALLVVAQERGLNDHLHRNRHRGDHVRNLGRDRVVLASLQPTDVDHQIDLVGAVVPRGDRLVAFHPGACWPCGNPTTVAIVFGAFS